MQVPCLHSHPMVNENAPDVHVLVSHTWAWNIVQGHIEHPGVSTHCPQLSLTDWVPCPCSVPGDDAQPSLGRMVMLQGDFWQHQTTFCSSHSDVFPHYTGPGFFYISFQGDSFHIARVSQQFPSYYLVTLLVIFLFTMMSFGQTLSRQCCVFSTYALCALTFLY